MSRRGRPAGVRAAEARDARPAKLLDRIASPRDLKSLSLVDLHKLAVEIRALILDSVSRHGGHLASNLGVVELTLALHYVFDSPRDKIIWDVGHQCYTHKILTGRRREFAAGLRCRGGLLGFPCLEESEHDAFNTGHASTALSAALGMAVALDRTGGDGRVIAVVGDGSLTGGVALEALNQIGHLRERLIIVLNYNEMSISPNVGALSKYLTYLVSGQHYLRIKDHAKSILKSIPVVGRPLIKSGRAIEDMVKKTFFPGLWFEELGIRYIGPVQGHSLGSLLEVFELAKAYDGPILLHCVTRKGRGYAPAFNDPGRYHGAGPFDIKTGDPVNHESGLSFSAAFGRAMVKVARREPRLVAVTAAMGEGTGLGEFSRLFPDRFFDVGIAEQHAVLFGAGLAVSGLKPVLAIYSTFLQRAYDQIYHDVALMGLPVVFVLDRAGVVPDDGPTHQGVNDIAYLRHMPGMVIMAPRDENQLQHMLATATACGRPAAVRFPKGRGPGAAMDEEPQPLSLGRAELLKEGGDLVLALGSMVGPALAAAEALEKEGLSLAVADARFAQPIDEELILSRARPGGAVFTVEEGILPGGFGAAVRELLDREKRFGVRFKAIGLPAEIIPLGTAGQIRESYGLDAFGIATTIREFLGRTPPAPGRRESERQGEPGPGGEPGGR